MTRYTISKDGIPLWTGDYASKEDAIAAYAKDLGEEALDYDAVDPDWKDALEVGEDDEDAMEQRPGKDDR